MPCSFNAWNPRNSEVCKICLLIWFYKVLLLAKMPSFGWIVFRRWYFLQYKLKDYLILIFFRKLQIHNIKYEQITGQRVNWYWQWPPPPKKKKDQGWSIKFVLWKKWPFNSTLNKLLKYKLHISKYFWTIPSNKFFVCVVLWCMTDILFIVHCQNGSFSRNIQIIYFLAKVIFFFKYKEQILYVFDLNIRT